MRLTAVAALLVALGVTSACTTYAIGKVSGSYGSDLAADRVRRLV